MKHKGRRYEKEERLSDRESRDIGKDVSMGYESSSSTKAFNAGASTLKPALKPHHIEPAREPTMSHPSHPTYDRRVVHPHGGGNHYLNYPVAIPHYGYPPPWSYPMPAYPVPMPSHHFAPHLPPHNPPEIIEIDPVEPPTSAVMADPYGPPRYTSIPVYSRAPPVFMRPVHHSNPGGKPMTEPSSSHVRMAEPTMASSASLGHHEPVAPSSPVPVVDNSGAGADPNPPLHVVV
jgi:hypothetical protein